MTHYTDIEALIVEPIPLVKDEAARHLLARKLEFTLSETDVLEFWSPLGETTFFGNKLL